MVASPRPNASLQRLYALILRPTQFFTCFIYNHCVVKSDYRVHLAVHVIHTPPHIQLPVYALVLTSATDSDLTKKVETWNRRQYCLCETTRQFCCQTNVVFLVNNCTI